MKMMKKLLSLTLAIVMVLSLAVTASAADATPKTYTITIKNDKTGHTYEAYQIFAGDLAVKDGEKVLSNIVWGDGVNPTTLMSALQATTTFAGCETAADVAEKLETPADAAAFAEIVGDHLGAVKGTSTGPVNNQYTISGLPAGYYLVKDKDNSLGEVDDAYTNFIIEVVGDAEAKPKTGEVGIEKKVKDKNDSTDEPTGWQDSADHDIGDTVEYQLTGQLPQNYGTYDTYFYKFTDTVSKGLTVNLDSVKVYVVNKAGTKTEITDIFEAPTLTPTKDTEGAYAGGNILVVECKDLSLATAVTDGDCEIVVEYTATLNENAVIGDKGNPNKVYLEYSNNPNHEGEGGSTGETNEDKVIVFTYKAIVNKVDPEKKPLAGAEFTLEKYNKATDKWNAITVVKNEAGTTFEFKGLDDGTYRITETKTPDGYNTIDPIYFKVEATHETNAENPKLTALTVTIVDKDGQPIDKEDATCEFVVVHTAGTITTDIVNKSGVGLPETGGIGTTIFYIVGGLLTLGAVVMLVTKKKMSVND